MVLVYSLAKGKVCGLWVLLKIYTLQQMELLGLIEENHFHKAPMSFRFVMEKGLYIAGGNNGVISTSTDGINWTQRTSLSGK